MAYLTKEQLDNMGFAEMGEHIFISDKASIYNPGKIKLGSYVRIDDFALLSAGEEGIDIGNFVHIACYACLIGHSKITIKDYSGISIRGTVLSSTSDFTGETLPQFKEFAPLNEIEGLTSVINKPVTFETCSVIGASTIVLPGVTIGSCTSVAPLSLVNKDLEPMSFYWGNPVRLVKKNKEDALKLVQSVIKDKFTKKK